VSRIGQFADTHGNVHALLHQVDISVVQQQIGARVRIGFEKAVHDARDVQPSKRKPAPRLESDRARARRRADATEGAAASRDIIPGGNTDSSAQWPSQSGSANEQRASLA